MLFASEDRKKKAAPQKRIIDAFEDCIKDHDADGALTYIYESPLLMNWFADTVHKYGLKALRENDSVSKAKLDSGEGIFDLVPAGQMAFVVLTYLNNYDLWKERETNRNDRLHECHGKKGGKWTKSAGGGGARAAFRTGWSKEGMAMHKQLLTFFTEIQEGTHFEQVKNRCRDWWAENGSTVGNSKAKKAAAPKPVVPVPDFARFAKNMASV